MIKVGKLDTPVAAAVEIVERMNYDFPTVTAKVNFLLKSPYRAGTMGICNPYFGDVRIFVLQHTCMTDLKATVAHEIAHCIHAQTMQDDWDARTEYGIEVYAERMAEEYVPEYRSNMQFTYYKGYKKQQVYKEYFPKWNWFYKSYGLVYCQDNWTATVERDGNGYKWAIDFTTGQSYYSSKITKLDTAKRNVVRKLRKLGIQV